MKIIPKFYSNTLIEKKFNDIVDFKIDNSLEHCHYIANSYYFHENDQNTSSPLYKIQKFIFTKCFILKTYIFLYNFIRYISHIARTLLKDNIYKFVKILLIITITIFAFISPYIPFDLYSISSNYFLAYFTVDNIIKIFAIFF